MMSLILNHFVVDQTVSTMVKRGGARFDPLPVSDESDPALLSHRPIQNVSGGGGAAAGRVLSPTDRHDEQNGLEAISKSGESQRFVGNLPTAIVKRMNGGAGDVHHDIHNEDDNDDEEEESLTCGLGPCFSPSWLQPLASKQMFLAVFCLACVLQGMFYTYFVSVLTTIEKLFQIQSKTTGIIMSATEMGQIGGALLLTYYGGQGHRPKWIGWGMVLFGASAGLCSLPHFLFWRTKPNTGSSSSSLSALSSSSDIQDGFSLMTGADSSSVAQQLEMDLICRQLDNVTIAMEPAISELERNQQCASKIPS